MTVRVFLEPGAIAAGQATVAGSQHHYLARVMRLGVGDEFTVLDGSGAAHTVRIAAIEKDRLLADIVATTHVPEPPVAVTLYQALPKADKLDWILQKATELGVSRVVPLAAARSVVQVTGDKREAKRDRWVKIATEAAEQSERARVPTVELPITPGNVRLADGEIGLVLAERAHAPSLPAALPDSPPTALALFVGPEGGWTPEELGALERAGVHPVSLGPRILRTETAALAALAIVMAKYELRQPG